MTKENQDAWLELAATQSSREIERAVAEVNPAAAHVETYQYLSNDFVRATLDVPEEVMSLLRRVQDIESQRAGKHVTMIEALEVVAREHLERRDPVAKAAPTLWRTWC